MGSQNEIWGRETNWFHKSERKVFVKIKSRPVVDLFLLHFYRQYMLHAVSCLRRHLPTLK